MPFQGTKGRGNEPFPRYLTHQAGHQEAYFGASWLPVQVFELQIAESSLEGVRKSWKVPSLSVQAPPA